MSDDAVDVSNGGQKKVYASAIDWWVLILLMLGPAWLLGLTIYFVVLGNQNDSFICLIAAAGTLFLTGIFTVPCRYTLVSDSLTIRCGLIFIRVPYESIREIEPSSSWVSAPALSLRRVKISTASRFYLVSPVDREHFIQALTERCASMETDSSNG